MTSDLGLDLGFFIGGFFSVTKLKRFTYCANNYGKHILQSILTRVIQIIKKILTGYRFLGVSYELVQCTFVEQLLFVSFLTA